MKLAGFQKFSLIDYPEKIAAIIFVQGCNFRCPFCHNRELVLPEYFSSPVDEEEIFDFLKSRKGKLQGVVITGGEPTIFTDLIDFVWKIKNLGFKVKLDTNGSNPEIIEKLLMENLIDYIAMDVKAPLEKYPKLTGIEVDKNRIRKSVDLIKNSNIDYEFRTTLIKGFFTTADILKILCVINGAKRYALQNFYPSEGLVDRSFSKFSNFKKDELLEFKKIARRYVKEVIIRS